MSSFDAKPVECHKLFEGESDLYKVPEYQRPYSWEEKHIEQLWEDLYGAWNDENTESYFLGSVILLDEGENRLSILDGQQRLTSLTILFAVLKNNFENELTTANHRRCQKRLRENTRKKGKQQRLRTGNRNNADFKTTILDNLKLDRENRYTTAAQIFDTNIEASFQEDQNFNEHQLNDFFTFLNESIQLIKISSSDISKAIHLFQTVNTRGKDLTISDLVKSYLLSTMQKAERDNFVEAWTEISTKVDEDYDRLDDILQSYRLYLQEGRPRESAYVELKGEFEDRPEDALEIVQEIKRFTKTHKSITNKQTTYLYLLENLNHKRYWRTMLVAARLDKTTNIDHKELRRCLPHSTTHTG